MSDNNASCGCPTYWVEDKGKPYGDCPYCEIDRLTAELAEAKRPPFADSCAASTYKCQALLEAEKRLTEVSADWIAREYKLKDLQEALNGWKGDADRAEKERDRYREALERIAGYRDGNMERECPYVAREALKEAGDE